MGPDDETSCAPRPLGHAAQIDVDDIPDALALEALLDGRVVIHVEAEVVDDLDDLLDVVAMRHEHPQVGGVLGGAFTPADVPGVADEELELVVVRDARGDVPVVILPLRKGDDAVGLLRIPERHELADSLRRRLLPVDDLRFEAHIVGELHVLGRHEAVAGLVENVVGHADEGDAALVHLAAQGPHELRQAHGAVAVLVKEVHEDVEVLVGEVNAVANQAALEVPAVQAVQALVHHLEGAAEAAHAGHAAGADDLQHLLDEPPWREGWR
mmetsp:Transcript_46334/g.144964  ORF Transcript_46334/g.144964 Transcript_46334/m.144964 type:complete len:269 (-) Transcript_46334:1032-1838(-)